MEHSSADPLNFNLSIPQGFAGGSVGKNLPSMQETVVQFLGQEDPLEKG